MRILARKTGEQEQAREFWERVKNTSGNPKERKGRRGGEEEERRGAVII